MNQPRTDMLGEGAYFLPADYVGLIPRIAIFVVDLATLAAFYIIGGILALRFTEISDDQFVMLFFVIAWFYLTLVKTSSFRTVGYRLLGARIVNLKGEKPSIVRMTFRFLLCLFGPFSFMFDLLWVSADEQKQTLRDRFAATCVIKYSAEPAGQAEIRFVFYNAFGFNLMYQQVMAPKELDAKEPAT